MSTLYTRGRVVWIGWTDHRGTRHNRSTAIKLDRPLKHDAAGKPAWPPTVLRFQKQFDASFTLGLLRTNAPRTGTTLTAALDEFLAAAGVSRKPATVRMDRLCVKRVVALVGDLRMDRVDEQQMVALRNMLVNRHGEQSAAITLRHLSGLFNWCVRQNIMASSPITKPVKLHPVPPLPVVFSDGELQHLWTAMDPEPDARNQLQFLLLSGFRSGESCALMWEMLDGDQHVIRHWNQKTKRWSLFPMDHTLSAFMEGLPRTWTPHVFRYRHVTTLSHIMQRYVRQLRLNPRLNVHALKKTYVARLIRAGVPATLTHQLAHHTSFTTTLQYYATFDVATLRDALAKSR